MNKAAGHLHKKFKLFIIQQKYFLLWHGFKDGLSKSIKMKKQSIPGFSIMNNSRGNQLGMIRKSMASKKTVKYIYTEKDLGEGLLEAGVPASYTVGKQLQYSN